MKSSIRSFLRPLLLPALLAAFIAPAVAQEQLVGLAPKNKLVFFLSTSPGNVEVLKVTGLAKGEKLLGIDRRPANGLLYALGSSSRIYTINTQTGAATALGTGPFTPALNGTRFGFDFNPVADRIRIISNTGQNLRAHPDTGVVAFTDLAITYALADPGAGSTPLIGGSGYTNSVAPTPATTTLYNIDSARDTLVTQIPPNDGVLNTVGALGVNATDVVGFDIAGSNGAAYASMQLKLKYGKSQRASLYTINLTTGSATLVGKIMGPYPITGLTALGSVAN